MSPSPHTEQGETVCSCHDVWDMHDVHIKLKHLRHVYRAQKCTPLLNNILCFILVVIQFLEKKMLEVHCLLKVRFTYINIIHCITLFI